MATLATWYDRWLGMGAAQSHAGALAEGRPARAADHRLRPFINEDIHFFVKTIDNTCVIREVDPQAPKACWSLIGAASAVTALLLLLLLPSGYSLLAGYQILELREENRRLLERKEALALEEARLLSPQRLAELARLQQFVDPDPDRVIHLSEEEPALAMKRPAGLGDDRQ